MPNFDNWRKKSCRICDSFALEKIFSWGNQPLVNQYLSKATDKVDLYPLELYRCTNCGLLQLGHVIPKEILFPDDYPYVPSISKTNLEHFDRISEALDKELGLKDALVIDIGSNDGSLLKRFQEKGAKVLGVEPAGMLAERANQEGISTIHDFISPGVAEDIVKKHGKAKLVTMTNVFAHVDDLHGLLGALDILLGEEGVFFAQFPDVRNLLSENQFDTVYHEHLSYFTNEPLHYLFSHSPFEIYKIENSKMHGGSMQIQVRRRINPFGNFILNTEAIKKELYEYLTEQIKQGKKVAGFAAAAKGVILLNYCGLGSEIVDYVVDGTPYKQGKFIPGVNIPIYPEEYLLEDPPDIILILAWNFKEEIMQKLKGRNYTFVIPIPKMEVLHG